MDILPTAQRLNHTRTGAHVTVRPASSHSHSEAWRPLRTSRWDEGEESRGPSGVAVASRLRHQSSTCGVVKGESSESAKSPLKLIENDTPDKESDQMRNLERQSRPEWRRSNLSSRSKSLDCRTGTKSPERPQSIRRDVLSRTGDKSVDRNRVMSTIHNNSVNKTQNEQNTSPSKVRGPSLPTRCTSASLGPKGGQSILERIEKLYGSVENGNTEDYKTTEHYRGSFGGTFPRRFSSGEHTQSSGQSSKDSSESTFPGRWQNQGISSRVDGGAFQSRGFSNSGTQSLDRARSRSTIAAKIRAARAAEELDKPTQLNTLTGITEVSTATGRTEQINRKNWSRTTIKERNTMKTLQAEDMQSSQGQTASDDVFESEKSLKTMERYKGNRVNQSAASVRNKINQFEALTQRSLSSSPRRAFSVPEHLSKNCDGVQRSSSAKALGSYWWGGLSEQQAGRRGEKREDQDKTTTKETDMKSVCEDGSKLKEIPTSKDSKDLKELSAKQDLHITEAFSPNFINVDQFSETPVKLREDGASSGSGMSTPTSSDTDETPTNTPGTSPLASPTALPRNAPLLTPHSPDPSGPLTSNLPDLVSRDSLNGRKRVLDLNAWLDGLNPQIKAWECDGEEDDDSTQKDEDSNYDSDSGESSVTVTSVMSKSFSVSLVDLCNFAGVDSDSDSDEWQSTGRRSASMSSDISGFSCVSVLPAEELDKLIQDVKSIGDDNLQDYEDVQVVVLHKDVGVGLGFSLAGGVDQNKPVTVHKVFPSGVAAQEGSVKEGDQVLSVNGTALSGRVHLEALKVLRCAKAREMGVVVLKKPDARARSNGRAPAPPQAPPPTHVNQTGRCVAVSLHKSNRDLGFSLEGGVGSRLGNKPLTVQKIFQGGPAEAVLPGDELLEVEGVSVVGLRRLEAWTLIRKLPPGPVRVVLRRNSASKHQGAPEFTRTEQR